MQDERPIRVLLAREGHYWVAQCLEYDIGAQVRDLDDLHERLIAGLDIQRQECIRHYGRPFAGIGPASNPFHKLWDQCAGSYTCKKHTTVPADPTLDIEFGVVA